MALRIDRSLTPQKLLPRIERLFELSAGKILSIENSWNPRKGTPVFTVKGRYTSRGWTEWTQGFQFGSALLQFDATGDQRFLDIGRRQTIERMATHVSHVGVHDHGFNNISTYGNLLRLMREGKIALNEREKDFYELALKVSGAVQAARWTRIHDGTGFIYSFNGPHSLFIDTMRSLRSLAVAHQLGHVLRSERDQEISLLQRLLEHAATTARYNVYYAERRDAYDVRGRIRANMRHLRAQPASTRRLPEQPRELFQQMGASGQFGGSDCSTGIDPVGELLDGTRRQEKWRALSPGCIDHRENAFRGAVFEHDSETSRLVAPLGLPSAERLGLHCAGPASAERRKLHVGRLPRARAGAAHSA